MTNLANSRIGHYELKRVLGEGGMGTVYLAKDEKKDRLVALKLLKPGNDDGRLAKRFKRECLALSKLNHPHLVEIFDTGEISGRLFYTMEYLDGKSVEELILANKSFSIGDVCAIIRSLADGLEEVHEAGLLHRDIKPANVIVEKGGRAVLTDFGLVKVKWMSNLTVSNVFVGSYQYASPEVLSGLQPDQRSDVYQLGLLAYILLTGNILPFGKSLQEIARKLMVERLPSPSVIRPDVPLKLDSCIVKAMERNPEDRFSSVSEFRDVLDDITQAMKIEEIESEREEEKEMPAPEIPYLSTTAVHLVLFISILYFFFSLSLSFKTKAPPAVPLRLALSWISSDWDALSFQLDSGKNLKLCIERMQRADRLLLQLNKKLAPLVKREKISPEEILIFLSKAEPALKLERKCIQAGISYTSPAEKTIEAFLKSLVQLAMKKNSAVNGVEKCRRYLLSNTGIATRTDRILQILQLPDSYGLLSLAETMTKDKSGYKQKLAELFATADEKQKKILQGMEK